MSEDNQQEEYENWKDPLGFKKQFGQLETGRELNSASKMRSILPFNASLSEYGELLDRSYSGELQTVISILLPQEKYAMEVDYAKLGERGSEAGDLLVEVMEEMEERRMPSGAEFIFTVDASIAPTSLVSRTEFAQNIWAEHGFYVQVGFAPAELRLLPAALSQMGMSLMLYDYLVERHNSMEPRDHLPIELPTEDARELAVEMGRVFQEGYLFLPRDLLKLRDEIAVKSRFVLSGEGLENVPKSFGSTSPINYLGVKYRF